MKKILYTALFLCSLMFNAQKNSLLSPEFWKSKPTVDVVKAEVEKGNSPSQFNGNTFDAAALSITNGAPIETIKFLVEQNGNSASKLTHDGRLYLHWAAMSGNVEAVDFLIKKGSDVNLLDDKGLTPLSFAAIFGVNDPKIYELLFNAGVNPKQKYQNGANVLLLSIGNDKNGELQKLFESKGLKITDTDDKGNTAFDYSATFGNLDFLKKLQAQGIKAHGSAIINAAQGTRRSSNGIEIFKYLIEDVKVSPMATSEDGATALQIIARKPKQTEIITYLISKGADANKADTEGNTPLMMASASHELDNVKLLAAHTKNINTVNKNGESALSFAVKNGAAEIIAFLLDKKADTKVLDNKGNNLAYYLVQSYRPSRPGQKDEFSEKLNILKTTGINFANPQKDGSTLLHLAVAKNDINLFKKLADFNININATDKDKMTALHKAALVAKDDVVLKYLVSLGADKSLKTEFDETAFDLANENEALKKSNVDINFLK